MPEFGGRHYMNPSYGRALASPPDAADDDAQECAKHGELKHVAVHPQKEGGFSVHAHYEHPRSGHHTVESKHATSEDAAEEVKRHLRGHEARRARSTRAAATEESSDE
jgi:hypothetical protein